MVAVALLPIVGNAPAPADGVSPSLITAAGGTGSGQALGVGQSPYYFSVSGSEVYVSDLTGNAVRTIDTATGAETTLAGTGFFGYGGDGGPSSSAELNQPAGIATDSAGDVFVTDQNNERIREIPSHSGTFFGIPMNAGDIYTVAGSGMAGFSGDGGPATSAKLSLPEGLSLDTEGDVVVADSYNGRVRAIAATDHTAFGVAMTAGDIYTIAGDGTGGILADSGDGGPATSAEIGTPQGVSVDPSGNLFVTEDFFRQAAPVREIPAQSGTFFGIAMKAGDIYTVAGGTSTSVCAAATDTVGDGCPATQATLSDPVDAMTGADGNLYITDYYHDRVRVVNTATGAIATYAGNGTGGDSGNGGPAADANLSLPTGLGVGTGGDLMVSDSSTIRTIDAATGIIEQIAGNGTFSFSGDGGPASDAQFGAPVGVAFDRSGDLFVTDAVNNVVRKIAPDGTISTVAGLGHGVGGIYAAGGYSGDGGTATGAELSMPIGVAVDATGNVYIADSHNYRIRKIAVSSDTISTVAGNGQNVDSGFAGPAGSAGLSDPTAVAVDSAGDLFIADGKGDRVLEIPAASGSHFGIAMAAGNIYSVAGDGNAGYSGDGGPATASTLNDPSGVATDPAGDLLVADRGNDSVREVPASSTNQYGIVMSANDIYTIAGDGTAGFSGDGGAASGAELDTPAGVAMDAAGNLWIADSANHRVREVAAGSGTISTAVGNGQNGIAGEGGPATGAELAVPVGIAVDGSGNVYVGEYAARSGFGYTDANGRVDEVVYSSAPPPPPPPSTGTTAGYWMLDSGGTVYPFGSATAFGSATDLGSAVAMSPVPGGGGYWVVNAAGFVDAFGSARAHTLSGQPGSNVVTIASTPDGGGYWLATATGQVITAGDAQGFGSMAGAKLNKPVVNMVPTPDGRGYWLLAGDGGIFTFGDAGFFGSTGSIHLVKPAVAMAPTSDGKGYWIVAADGGLFTFGDATFYGSTGQLNPARAPGGSNSIVNALAKPVNGIVVTGDGAGYWMVAGDGGVFAFGDAGFVGSLGNNPPQDPIVAFAPS